MRQVGRIDRVEIEYDLMMNQREEAGKTLKVDLQGSSGISGESSRESWGKLLLLLLSLLLSKLLLLLFLLLLATLLL